MKLGLVREDCSATFLMERKNCPGERFHGAELLVEILPFAISLPNLPVGLQEWRESFVCS